MSVLYADRLVNSVLLVATGEFLEPHDVLGKRSCFVAEDVGDHAQFLIQVDRLHLGRKISVCIIDVHIPHYEVSLDETDHFKRGQKRDWHKVHEVNEPKAES